MYGVLGLRGYYLYTIIYDIFENITRSTKYLLGYFLK